MVTRALPKFNRVRLAGGQAEPLVRLEAEVAKYADGLTAPRTGLLSNGLTLAEHFRGRVVEVVGLVAPATPVPPALWPTTSQVTLVLGDSFPGEPRQVLVQDAFAPNTGQHVGPLLAVWVAGENSAGPTVTLQRVDGLTAGVAYTLTVAVLA